MFSKGAGLQNYLARFVAAEVSRRTGGVRLGRVPEVVPEFKLYDSSTLTGNTYIRVLTRSRSLACRTALLTVVNLAPLRSVIAPITLSTIRKT